MERVVAYAVGGLLATAVLLGGTAAGILSALLGGTTGASASGCDPDATGPRGLTGEQTCNVATIIDVGHEMSVPRRGWVVAVAVALQESSLRNLPGGDRDSVGLFQQRPSQGWGTREQLTDPAYASRAFYTRLLHVPGWQDMPLAEAAQKVQRSADGSLYAKHETRAAGIVTACQQQQCGTYVGRWVRPAPGPVVSGFRPPDRPGHDGIDIGAPRGTTIRAASAGTVITVECDSSSGTCDQDGGPSVLGCGWHTEIRHSGSVVTRNCHMLRRPAVREGQPVTAGQPIGLVGSSGNSSGPHLHFEVHLRGDLSSRGATDPAAFLRARAVSL